MFTRLSEGSAKGVCGAGDFFDVKDVERAEKIITKEARTAFAQGCDYGHTRNRVADIPGSVLDDEMRAKWERGEVMGDSEYAELDALLEKAQYSQYAYLEKAAYSELQYGRGYDGFDAAAADAEEDRREKEKHRRIKAGLLYEMMKQTDYREYFQDHPYQTDAERAERVRKFKAKQEWEDMKSAIRNEPDRDKRAKLTAENLDIV